MPIRFPRLTPTVKKLLILLAAAFVTIAVVENLVGLRVYGLLSLGVATGPAIEWAWQPLTFWLAMPPLPQSLWDLPLTLLFIYFFLSPFEESFGAKRTVQLAAVGVIAAALSAMSLSLALTSAGLHLGNPIHGAGSIALAAFGAFPIIAGNREILLMFVIPMKVWTVMVIGLVFSALLALTSMDPYIFVTYSASLGAGVGFAKWLTRPRTPMRPKPKPRTRRGGPDLKVVRGGADDDEPRYLN